MDIHSGYLKFLSTNYLASNESIQILLIFYENALNICISKSEPMYFYHIFIHLNQSFI